MENILCKDVPQVSELVDERVDDELVEMR